MMTELVREPLIANVVNTPPPKRIHIGRLNFVMPDNIILLPIDTIQQANMSKNVWLMMKTFTVPLNDFFELTRTNNTNAFARQPTTPMNKFGPRTMVLMETDLETVDEFVTEIVTGFE